MDWNMLYTNGDAPSLKQIAEYIDNPLGQSLTAASGPLTG